MVRHQDDPDPDPEVEPVTGAAANGVGSAPRGVRQRRQASHDASFDDQHDLQTQRSAMVLEFPPSLSDG
jgi:hypothetical protein